MSGSRVRSEQVGEQKGEQVGEPSAQYGKGMRRTWL